MEIYPGVTFSEELEGQLFASIMLDMEKLISGINDARRQGNHSGATVIVGCDGVRTKKTANMSAAF